LANDQEALLQQTFHELQDMGLISPNRTLSKLKRGPKKVPIFHVHPIRRNRIFYWLDNHVFEVDGLRFALLHEERHLTGGHLNGIAYSTSLVVWSCFFILLALTGRFLEGPSAVIYLLLPVAVYYTAMPFLMISERRSDLWAASLLKDRFNVSRPSLVLARALDFPPPNMSPGERFLRRISHVDYHPSKEKRIGLIAKEVDDR